MEINIYTLFIILFVHWLADFIFQSDRDAKGKSTSIKRLLSHTSIYSLIWLLFIAFYSVYYKITYDEIMNYSMWLFPIITFILHTLTDYITSKEVKKFFDDENYHGGFCLIGFDQLLHIVQLVLTFKLLS